VPEFDINLDLVPEDRFVEVVNHFKEPLMNLVDHFHGTTPTARLIAMEISKRRGPENAEFMGEIKGIAKTAGIPVAEIHMVQMLYEINTLMIPLVNFSGVIDSINGVDLEEVGNMLEAQQVATHAIVPRFACTGIIALNREDNTVYHARNLDFYFAPFLQPLTYTGIYKKNGIEVFRAQSIAGYPSILTGMRKGVNGFTIEINTRFTDHIGGNAEMFRNLFKNKREISGWTKRKILEEHDNYEDAVEAFSNTPYSASEYNIIAGVKKGVILGRNADGLAYQIPLNESSKDYIIMTNFDYVFHDIREIFDPTEASGKGLFHPRRKAAEKLLDQAKTLTPELLFDVLNDEGVMAKDTIFQVIMNVEQGLWNASLPACLACGRNSSILI